MPDHPPIFQDLDHVRVTGNLQVPAEGFVVASLPQNGRWLYKVSLPDPDEPGTTFDNWYPEDSLDKIA